MAGTETSLQSSPEITRTGSFDVNVFLERLPKTEFSLKKFTLSHADEIEKLYRQHFPKTTRGRKEILRIFIARVSQLTYVLKSGSNHDYLGSIAVHSTTLAFFSAILLLPDEQEYLRPEITR